MIYPLSSFFFFVIIPIVIILIRPGPVLVQFDLVVVIISVIIGMSVRFRI